MADYRLILDSTGNLASGVQRVSDRAFIPDDRGNADWRTYQDWLAAGGVPDPVDARARASAEAWQKRADL